MDSEKEVHGRELERLTLIFQDDEAWHMSMVCLTQDYRVNNFHTARA
jgi:hypothetical protein